MMARKIACLLVVLFSGAPLFAEGVGAIAGVVKDRAGIPQMGAVVQIFTSATTLGATVFTDANGYYSAENLAPGTYQVRVSAAWFMPSLKENVGLRAGARVLVNVTLNAIANTMMSLPERRTPASAPDDWHWTLRSVANRPILRMKDDDPGDPGTQPAVASEKPEDHALKARVAFIAGSQAEGFGSAGDMTTAFALEKSLFSVGTLSFGGNIGATPGDPTGVLRAAYSHDFGAASHPTFTLTYRRFASPGTVAGNIPTAAMELNTSDSMTLGEFIDLQYGAAMQSLEASKRIMALRPYGAVTLHLSPNLIVEYRYSTSEPDTRAAKGFESAPADLSESGPRMALTNGVPIVERAQHQEVSASRRFGKTSVQVAYYLDHVRDAVLTGAGDPSSYSDDVLPDIYSGTFSYAYPGSLSTTGARVVVERKIITDELTATADYSTGGAVTADAAPGTWQNVPQSLATARQHSIAGKLSGYIPVSGTRWIASYKWTSGNAVSAVDAFNASPGQADAYLSIFIRQPLPSTSFIPAKMDALVDVRNLLAQGYLPVAGNDGRTIYLLQSARSLRGGLSFTF
jgi:hypothetical protein